MNNSRLQTTSKYKLQQYLNWCNKIIFLSYFLYYCDKTTITCWTNEYRRCFFYNSLNENVYITQFDDFVNNLSLIYHLIKILYNWNKFRAFNIKLLSIFLHQLNLNFRNSIKIFSFSKTTSFSSSYSSTVFLFSILI